MILALTSVPGSDLPDISPFPEADKVVHFGLYVVLGLLSVRAAWTRSASVLVRILFAIGLFAALDEIHQHFIPGRSMDGRDWMADIAGAAVGILVFQLARRRREQLT